jgi:hypothetical protein
VRTKQVIGYLAEILAVPLCDEEKYC